MSGGDWFVLAVALLQAGGAAFYLRARQYPMALMCLGAVVINAAVIWNNMK